MAPSSRMASRLLSLLSLTGLTLASQWTVTSYIVLSETQEVYTDNYYTDVDVYTLTYWEQYSLKPSVTYPTSAATSSYTYSDDLLEIVEVYLDPAAVDADDLQTTTPYDEYTAISSYTYMYFVAPLVFTAPTSCPTSFTFSTTTEISIPSEVIDQYTDTDEYSFDSIDSSVYTSYYDSAEYTYITVYVPEGVFTLSDLTDDYYYSYYIAYCTNPTDYFYGSPDETSSTTTDFFFTSAPTITGGGTIGDGGDSDGDSDNINADTRFGIEECPSLMRCGWLSTALIVIAAILPAIFLLGFLESYLWFRRLMIGKSALRFGTVCWMFLLLPVICLTRRTPARDLATQEALRAQWKATPFGKALGLWFKYGFRHKYPIELLGGHPTYNSAPGGLPQQPQQQFMAQKPIGYGPPPAGGVGGQPPVVYYLPTNNARQSGTGPRTSAAPMPHPAARTSQYPQYPQYPQQAAYNAPHQRQRERDQPGPVEDLSSPSPVSQHAVTSDEPPRLDVSPPQGSLSPVTLPGEPAEPPPPPPTQTEGGPSGTRR